MEDEHETPLPACTHHPLDCRGRLWVATYSNISTHSSPHAYPCCYPYAHTYPRSQPHTCAYPYCYPYAHAYRHTFADAHTSTHSYPGSNGACPRRACNSRWRNGC